MVLLQLKFGGVLDSDDPLIVWYVSRENVESRSLARAGAA